MNTKLCIRCEKHKPTTEFSVDKRAKSGTQTYCKTCQAKRKKQMASYYRDHHLKKKYGITHEDYLAMLKNQNSKCAICGIEEKYCENQRFAVDHDHDTDEVRALLCKKCNQAIGLFQDSSLFCTSAANYLKGFGK